MNNTTRNLENYYCLIKVEVIGQIAGWRFIDFVVPLTVENELDRDDDES